LARAGNEADDDAGRGLRTWLERHGAALLLYARQFCATSADAEDAVQAGVLRCWERAGAMQNPGPYLYACVRTAALDSGRQERRRFARERAVARDAGPSAFEDPPIERAERQVRIEAALAHLPAEQREVVVMKVWGGLTFAQIAEALGVPPGTAASRYRYALAGLGRALSQEVAHER
jgi:RNA polymerase sigma-70 factor, ECF subfamily